MPASSREGFNQWLTIWLVKGLVVPIGIWALMNIGLSFALQPFMPQIQAVRNAAGNWVPIYMRVLATGIFVASSHWSAATLGWSLYAARSELDAAGRKQFRETCLSWFALLILPALFLLKFGGYGLSGLAVFIILGVIARNVDSVLNRKRFPMYSRAIARIKFGKYAEAEWEIIRELEKCEDDFQGWMMMAELYATHFRDLNEAQKTVAEVCEHPNTTAPQFALALNRLADWQLKQGEDPEGARRALQVICDRLPGTHLARMAQLRIRQLPQTVEELHEQTVASPIPLPALGDNFDEEPPKSHTREDLAKAAETANGLVKRLETDPDDVATRERLARMMAERLNQAENGIEQLTLLLEMPDQSDAQRAQWLSLIAAWQMKHLGDLENGRRTLERLAQDFPKSPQAIAARRRLQLMDRQLKSKE